MFQLIDLVTGDAYNVIASIKGEEWVVEVVTKLPEGTQPQISVEELAQAENVVKTDPRVVALAKEIGMYDSIVSNFCISRRLASICPHDLNLSPPELNFYHLMTYTI